MTDAEKNQETHSVSSAQRRLGFVALLWWIAAVTGTIGVAQGMPAGWARLLFIGISWVLAIFFSYAWLEARKGRLSQ